MSGFLKQVFVVAMTFFSYNILNINSLECVLMNDQECNTRTKIININNNELVFYPFSMKVNKCSGSCNNINETCKCICRLSASVCNSRQRWNEDKCRCECKNLIDEEICDKGCIWNPNNC